MGRKGPQLLSDYGSLTRNVVASAEQTSLNAPHAPHQNAIDAFNTLLPTIKSEILKSRHHWNRHEPRMWSRAAHISDAELTSFNIEDDLVEVNQIYFIKIIAHTLY